MLIAEGQFGPLLWKEIYLEHTHMKNTFGAFACKKYTSCISLQITFVANGMKNTFGACARENTFGACGHEKYIWSICAWKIHLKHMGMKNTFGAYAHEKYIRSIWAWKIHLEHVREKSKWKAEIHTQTMSNMSTGCRLWTIFLLVKMLIVDKVVFLTLLVKYEVETQNIKCWTFQWKLSDVDLNNHLPLPHVRHVFNFVQIEIQYKYKYT